MWRAWGILLAILSPQGLGARVSSPDHEFSFCPPAGWIRHLGSGPTLLKYTQPGDHKVPSEFLVTHLFSANPTPIEIFKRQAREGIAEKYPGSKILEEKDVTVAGKRGYRVVFSHDDGVLFKTVVHRNNLEYYLLDGVYPPDLADTMRPLFESVIASFEIVPQPLSSEERLADGRTMALFQAGKIDPALLGERWYTVWYASRRIGRLHYRMAESEGLYSFESDVHNDFGDGASDATSVHGSFSPDGRVQKVDTEEIKVTPKLRSSLHASAAVRDGQAKITREISGIKEERTLPVEEGVLLTDVAECMRSVLVGAGRGSYLLKALSPYSDEWSVEMIDVGGAESLEVDGQTRDCVLVQAFVGRRKNMTYFYGPDRWVFRVGGPKEPFCVRASTREEAEK